jgi:hypothetical protein
MSDRAEDRPATAQCPYCGCGFQPSEPGQVFCSPFCEQQHALERGGENSGDA